MPERDYHALLHLGSLDVLAGAHGRVLAGLETTHRETIWAALREWLIVGTRTRPDDVKILGRLIAVEERRCPTALLDHLDDNCRRALVSGVLDAVPADLRELAQRSPVPAPPTFHDPGLPRGRGWDRIVVDGEYHLNRRQPGEKYTVSALRHRDCEV